jgi:hypothetical protein
VSGIPERGIEATERDAYDTGMRTVIYRDPDGNEISYDGAAR